MNTYYPVLLKLEGKPCVVIGGGWGTATRVRDLLDAGARVTLISPEPHPELELLAMGGRIRWDSREYRRGDLEGAFLAVACPSNRCLNAEIHAEADSLGIPVNTIDDLPHCSFIFPAIHRQGDLVIAVSSAGKSPALAVWIRDRIAGEFGPEYGAFLDLLGEMRPAVIERHSGFEQRRPVWCRLIDSGALEQLRTGNPEAARALLEKAMEEGEQKL